MTFTYAQKVILSALSSGDAMPDEKLIPHCAKNRDTLKAQIHNLRRRGVEIETRDWTYRLVRKPEGM